MGVVLHFLLFGQRPAGHAAVDDLVSQLDDGGQGSAQLHLGEQFADEILEVQNRINWLCS